MDPNGKDAHRPIGRRYTNSSAASLRSAGSAPKPTPPLASVERMSSGSRARLRGRDLEVASIFEGRGRVVFAAPRSAPSMRRPARLRAALQLLVALCDAAASRLIAAAALGGLLGQPGRRGQGQASSATLPRLPALRGAPLPFARLAGLACVCARAQSTCLSAWRRWRGRATRAPRMRQRHCPRLTRCSTTARSGHLQRRCAQAARQRWRRAAALVPGSAP